MISSVFTDSVSTSGGAVAVDDLSGSVSAIHNTGQIDAFLVPTDNSFVLTGPTVAINVSQSANGVAITQSPSTTFGGVAGPQFTGSVSGTTLTVTSVTSGNLAVGETIYGSGIVAGTTITAEGNGTGGNGTYTLSTTQTVTSEMLSAASALPQINGDILFGNATAAQPNVFDVEAGTTKGALSELYTGLDTGNQTTTNRNLDITVNNATVTITKAQLHQVTTLNVGAGAVLVAAIDPSFAIGGSNPTPIFDTTVHTLSSGAQSGPDGTATFASGAQIGITLDGLQTAQSATYEFVHTSGVVGALTVGALDNTQLLQAPYLYTAVAAVDGADTDLDVTVSLKSAQQLGLNASGAAAFNAIFNALEHNSAMAGAIVTPTTQASFLTLYNQLVPDQGLGTFDTLEAATEKISDLTDQPPDAGTRIAGTSAWLQEVNTTVKRNDGETLGSTDKAFGLVGGLEKMGKAGGALGLTVSYLNIQDAGTFEPIGGQLVTNLVEVGGYYRRAWGNLRISARAAGGYAWFGEDRMFVTTGVSETSKGQVERLLRRRPRRRFLRAALRPVLCGRPELRCGLHLPQRGRPLRHRRRPRVRRLDRPAGGQPHERRGAAVVRRAVRPRRLVSAGDLRRLSRCVLRQRRQHGRHLRRRRSFHAGGGRRQGRLVHRRIRAEGGDATVLRGDRRRSEPAQQRTDLRRLPLGPRDVLRRAETPQFRPLADRAILQVRRPRFDARLLRGLSTHR